MAKAEPNKVNLEIVHEIVNAVRDEYGLASVLFTTSDVRPNRGYEFDEANNTVKFRRFPLSYRSYFKASVSLNARALQTEMIGKMIDMLRARKITDE